MNYPSWALKAFSLWSTIGTVLLIMGIKQVANLDTTALFSEEFIAILKVALGGVLEVLAFLKLKVVVGVRSVGSKLRYILDPTYHVG